MRAVSVWLGLGLLSASLASVALGARVVLRDDPATVAFYKQVQASYRTVPAVRVRRHGFLWYSASVKGSMRSRFGPKTRSRQLMVCRPFARKAIGDGR